MKILISIYLIKKFLLSMVGYNKIGHDECDTTMTIEGTEYRLH